MFVMLMMMVLLLTAATAAELKEMPPGKAAHDVMAHEHEKE